MIGASIFGLDEAILVKCDPLEATRFNRLAIFFLALILIGAISFYYLFFLLSGDYAIPFVGSGLLLFVFYTILRFTIISINVPLTEVISLKKMMFSSANIFRIVLFSAFVFTMLAPIFALFQHKTFGITLNEYKSELLSNYATNKEITKNKQLFIIQQDIDKKLKEKKQLQSKLNNNNTSIENGIIAFQIKKTDFIVSELKDKLSKKDSALTYEKQSQIKQYNGILKSSELPFFRFGLIFSKPIYIIFFLAFFLVFISIIPLYIRVIVSKKSKYALIFSKTTVDLIKSQYQDAKNDCARYYQNKYSFRTNELGIYEDSPFNTKPFALKAKKVSGISLFSHLEKISNEHTRTSI